MSKYTTELRYICENAAGNTESKGYTDIPKILAAAAPKIFDFDYPIFDDDYKLPLEIKILRHYYTREISEETVGLWKLRLADRMNLIMPYYNQLYKSQLLQFEPLQDVDLTRDHITKNEGTENKAGNKTIETTGNRTLDSKGNRNIDKTTNSTETDNGTSTSNQTSANTTDATNNTTGTQEQSGKNDRTTDTTVTTNSTGTKAGNNWTLFSDTPQGSVISLAGKIPQNTDVPGDTSTLAGEAYLTNATNNIISEQTTSKSNDTSNTADNQTSTNKTTTSTDETQELTSTTTNNENNTAENTNIYNSKANDTETSSLNNTENTTSNNTENVTDNTHILNTEDYLEHVKGKQGTASYSKLLNEYRETFLNIDMQIIEELEPLFFGLWA